MAIDPERASNPTYWADEIDEMVDRLRLDLGFLPYDPTPMALYAAEELYRGFRPEGEFYETVDQQIYRRAHRAGEPPVHPIEALGQRLHDHGITVALNEFRSGRDLVGVMGGHAMVRGSAAYRQVVEIGRRVSAAGFCVVTGGGPGAMEAANLGAATVDRPVAEVEAAIDRLAEVPGLADGADAFIGVALEVAATLGEPAVNLSVPTWFYGHEPSNPFASHIAKYFSNSEREAGLLAIAQSGIVFAPGGPATLQEVFQDGAQNAYETYGSACPMVFVDGPEEQGWWERSGVLAALDRAFVDHHGRSRPGRELVARARGVDQVVEVLERYRAASTGNRPEGKEAS